MSDADRAILLCLPSHVALPAARPRSRPAPAIRDQIGNSAVQRSGVVLWPIGKAQAAYFKKINDEGGINGRKINFISYDDAFSPPKAVEQARKLVESDEVLLVFQPLGTQSNSATQKYMNAKKVPQLFVATGATKWGDPQNFPWTMGWQPNYQSEGRIYAAYILKNFPNGKIAALWQNDDAGKDQMKGCAASAPSMIIADKSYEVGDPPSTGCGAVRCADLDLGGARVRAGHPQGRETRLGSTVTST